MAFFASSDYGEDSLMTGRIIEKYCSNCKKTVRIYQFSPDSSIYTADASFDFLKYYIPKKHDFFLSSIDFYEELIEMINDNENINKIKDFIEDNNIYNLYELCLNDYLNVKSSGFNSNQLIKDVGIYIESIKKDLDRFDDFIICMNFTEDNFNLDLNGKIFDVDVCPECEEKFYPISLKNPCPICGKNTMERSRDMID